MFLHSTIDCLHTLKKIVHVMSIDIRKYHVLYAKNTSKKFKLWEEGVLFFNLKNRKASLYNKDNRCVDYSFLRRKFDIGDEFPLEQFLVQIDSLKVEQQGDCIEVQSIEPLDTHKTDTPILRGQVKRKTLPLSGSTNSPSKLRKSFDRKQRVPIYSKSDINESSSSHKHSVLETDHSVEVPLEVRVKEAEVLLNKQAPMNSASRYSFIPPTKSESNCKRGEDITFEPMNLEDHSKESHADSLFEIQHVQTKNMDAPHISEDDLFGLFEMAHTKDSTGITAEDNKTSNIKSHVSNKHDYHNIGQTQPSDIFSLSSKPKSTKSISDILNAIKKNKEQGPLKQKNVQPQEYPLKREIHSRLPSNVTTSLDKTIPIPIDTKVNAMRKSSKQTATTMKSKPQNSFVKPAYINPFDNLLSWNFQNITFLSPDNFSKVMHDDRFFAPKRSINLPNSFQNLEDYKVRFCEAILEEINIQTAQLAYRFHSFMKSLGSFQPDKKNQKLFRVKTNVPVYFNCEFVSSGSDRKRMVPSQCQFYLKFNDDSKEHYSNYAKDDIWIISQDPKFRPKTRNDLFMIGRSIYHGPLQSGIIEVKPIEPCSLFQTKEVPMDFSWKDLTVHCIRGPNVSSELAMLNNLENLDSQRTPILEYLLSGCKEPFQTEHSSVLNCPRKLFHQNVTASFLYERFEDIQSRYILNEDQRRVLEESIKWFLDPQESKSQSPVILVHGVFGSGKSHMLVVLIIFLCEVLSACDPEGVFKVLVSSSTNVAVDRILLGLLENDFTDFIRVGSLKRIARDILPYSIHREKKDGSNYDNERNDRAALRDLQEMLNEGNLSKNEKRLLVEQIESIKNGTIEKRMSLIKQVRVVGATCAATLFPILEDNTFPIVILDECSQMTEPMSLLPIGKFGCQALVLVGDPMQLPPPLSSFSINETDGLGKTLFSRIAHQGTEPIMLKTQYRLHPKLTEYVNSLFYDNKLKNGITWKDRPPLYPNLPPLLFCDAQDGNERANIKGSWENGFEAMTVVHILNMLLDYGIQGHQVGVICLYKAQEIKIKDLLKDKGNTGDVASESEDTQESESEELSCRYEGIQVSTVDAFQGAERDIIIMTCSRTSSRGFIDSPYRMNVALTRAKHHLIIVANAEILCESKLWREVLLSAKKIENGLQSADRILIENTFH